MRRTGTISQRSDGRFQIRYTIGTDMLTGKRKRLSVTITGTRKDGQPLKPDSLTGEFCRAIRKIPNVPVVRFHDLRHSHATQLLTEGIHPKIAQERLGHSSIKTTLDLYSHVTDTMQDEAATKLDSLFRSVIRAKPKFEPHLG